MNFKQFMEAWAEKCMNNPALAVISLPFIVVFSLFTAIVLFLKGDKRWKKCI